MADYMDAADVAKLVRKALKAEFPGQKFRVNTDKYSGGASIDVAWVDGPALRAVEAVAKPFRGTDFDGMTDSSTSRGDLEYDGISFRSGASFVFCERTLSEAVLRGVVESAFAGDELAGVTPPKIEVHSDGDAWVDYYHWDARYDKEDALRRAVGGFLADSQA